MGTKARFICREAARRWRVGRRRGCLAWRVGGGEGGGGWQAEKRERRNWSRVEQMIRVLGDVRGWRRRWRKEMRDGDSSRR